MEERQTTLISSHAEVTKLRSQQKERGYGEGKREREMSDFV